MKYFISIFIGCILLYSNVTAQALTNGEYLIKVNQTGKYLAIAGASRDNGAWLIQWDNEYTSHFKFLIKQIGGGAYSIQAKHSGKYLSTEGTPQRGAKLVQWDWLNQDNQKWYLTAHSSGKGYVLKCMQNNMKTIIQNWGASTARPVNGAYLFLSDAIPVDMILDFKKNETDQIEGNQFKAIPAAKTVLSKTDNSSVKLVKDVPDGIYKIYINQSKKYLAIAGQEDISDRMRLVQWDMLPINNHLFEVRKLDNGSYTIKPVHSQKVLDVVDMRTEDGTQIQQWDNLNTANQQWKFYNEKDGVSIFSTAAGKKMQLSAGANNTSNGTPLIITNAATQTFQLLPARAVKFTDYITLKKTRLTVPHGGDLDMYGNISVYLVDRHGNSYNRYYESKSLQSTGGDNKLFFYSESYPLNMDKLRVADLNTEVKFKISSEELVGAKIIVVYSINENDADIATTNYGAYLDPDNSPDSKRQIDTKPYKGGGSDDFFRLKNVLNDCLRSKLNGKEYGVQEFFVSDIPASCLVHVNLQDEDGSENWLDVFFTITKERKL